MWANPGQIRNSNARSGSYQRSWQALTSTDQYWALAIWTALPESPRCGPSSRPGRCAASCGIDLPYRRGHANGCPCVQSKYDTGALSSKFHAHLPRLCRGPPHCHCANGPEETLTRQLCPAGSPCLGSQSRHGKLWSCDQSPKKQLVLSVVRA